MPLGPHTIVLRKRQVTGQDRYGNDVPEDVDVAVDGCLVTPTRSSETDDRSAPRISGAQLLAPPGTDVDSADAIIWRERSYEVDGETGIWDECVEAQLRRTS
jgi:hypothetical protein